MFKGKLLDFQQEDVDKLKSKRARLCGNEPGTGKTYVGIALDQLNRAGDGNDKVNLAELFKGKAMKTLVVVPKSVLSSWDEHLMELTEDDIYLCDTKNRHRILAHLKDRRRGGYFIVTWDFIRLEVDALEKIHFLHVIADEVHYAKGRKSQQTRALKRIPCIYKTGLSGTPADNAPQDLWSILNWLWPKYYSAYNPFVDAYVEYETTEEGFKKLAGPNMENLPILHKEMEPWFTRRLKKDVLQDLPDKYYTRVWVDLDPKQRKAYDQMAKVMIAWVDQHKEELDRNDPIIAKAAVSQLVRLQQYACGYVVPLIGDDGGYVYKRKHKGHKRGECTYDDVPLGELEAWEGQPCRDVQQFEVLDPSSKLDWIMEYLNNTDHQVVIWSHFKSVIYLLEKRLLKAGITYGTLTGDVNQAGREEAIRRFQTGQARVFIGTIAAGGTGIQLQNANTSIFIGRTWSPSKNTQAEDRQHRIGQKNAVQVIDLMARNTVDLGQHQKIAMKTKWLAMMLGDEVDVDKITHMMAEEPELDMGDFELEEE
jgi:SNF2 family DNA or RNA helicase